MQKCIKGWKGHSIVKIKFLPLRIIITAETLKFKSTAYMVREQGAAPIDNRQSSYALSSLMIPRLVTNILPISRKQICWYVFNLQIFFCNFQFSSNLIFDSIYPHISFPFIRVKLWNPNCLNWLISIFKLISKCEKNLTFHLIYPHITFPFIDAKLGNSILWISFFSFPFDIKLQKTTKWKI